MICFIENTVQMNILAATAPDEAKDEIYNVTLGDHTLLSELYVAIKDSLTKNNIDITRSVKHRNFCDGDILHSQADISKASRLFGYRPTHKILQGINDAMPWYIKYLK